MALQYSLSNFKPLVIESYRHITFKGETYKRRLRISKFNAQLIDQAINTHIAEQNTRFVVLDLDDIKKVCEFLNIDFKSINTYFDINLQMCY